MGKTYKDATLIINKIIVKCRIIGIDVQHIYYNEVTI